MRNNEWLFLLQDQGSYEVVEWTSSSSFTSTAAFTGFEFWSTGLQLHETMAWEFIQQKYIDAAPKIYNTIISMNVMTHGDDSVGVQVSVAFTVRDFPGWYKKEHTLAWSSTKGNIKGT